MSIHLEVLQFLRPDGGYIAYGTDYEGIQFVECEPFSKQEYEAAFLAYDEAKALAAAETAAKRSTALTKLEALGLTTDDLKALGL